MAGRYDRVNGAFSKVQKRYDKVNGVWAPTKKRYDKIGGVWAPSYTGAICSAAFASTDYYGSAPLHFTGGSFNHDTGEIIANFRPSGSWQSCVFNVTFDEDQQLNNGDTWLSITVNFSGGVQQWVVHAAARNSSGHIVYGYDYSTQKNALSSGETVTFTDYGFAFHSIEVEINFEGLVTQAIVPAGGLIIANKVITGFHD